MTYECKIVVERDNEGDVAEQLQFSVISPVILGQNELWEIFETHLQVSDEWRIIGYSHACNGV